MVLGGYDIEQVNNPTTDNYSKVGIRVLRVSGGISYKEVWHFELVIVDSTATVLCIAFPVSLDNGMLYFKPAYRVGPVSSIDQVSWVEI